VIDKVNTLQVVIAQVESKDLYRVIAHLARHLAFVRDDKAEYLYVRMRNSTWLLSTRGNRVLQTSLELKSVQRNHGRLIAFHPLARGRQSSD